MNAFSIDDPVRVTKHRPGWQGRVHSCCYGMYYIRLTHDPDGERLAYRHIDGPYVARELKPLSAAKETS